MLFCYPLFMDNLRVFSTFPKSSTSYKGNSPLSKGQRYRSMPKDKNGMVKRSLNEKPSLSRSEILEKLEKAQGPAKVPQKKAKGQKFGDGFMKVGEDGKEVSSNDPRDPMTSEKLKSMLNSGAVNFSGKEQEVLRKILGN